MAASECTDGAVMSLMNKRLRALKKKYNRILQTEEAISQGKVLNKEQEELIRSKPSVLTLIDEYEKLRQPLSAALQEELSVTHTPQVVEKEGEPEKDRIDSNSSPIDPNREESLLEDLIKAIYFSYLFDVKTQRDFTNIMLTRTHERGCCLTYDYVTDDATDLLAEKDLDMISVMGTLMVSRPVHSSLPHKNALQKCIEHAKLWLANSDLPIEEGGDVTYAALREKLDKILASDYFTATPEMKAPVEVAAAAGNYAPSHVPVQGSSVSSEVSVHSESDYAHYEQKDEETEYSEGQEGGADQSSPSEELLKESEVPNSVDGGSTQQDIKQEVDAEEQNSRDVESKDQQQFNPRRGYQNNRGGNRGGGGGGRRGGYPNGRGGRGSRGGGGGYQNGGRGQYYDQPGNYYPRNFNNTRGRGGGRGAGGGNAYNNYGSARGGHAQAEELRS